MKKLTCVFTFILITVFFITPQIILGVGVPQGTIITNARDLDLDNYADEPGEVVASYTNTGGYTNFAKATNVTTSTVSAGYDLSTINLPVNGSGGPGTSIDYTYTITNFGNISAQMKVKISSNGYNAAWGAPAYELWTNYGSGFGRLNGPANWVSNELVSVAADSSLQLRVRVNIPGGAADSSTNEFFFEIWDPAWIAAAGDAWPGIFAIAPATADTGDTRDYQSDYVVTTVSGPVIELQKSVDITSAKPFEELTYTIRYTNTGSGTAYNVTIDDVIYTNFVRIGVDSAETNNSAAHNPTNYYYMSGSWQNASADSGAPQSVERVRWVLRSPVLSGGVGTLEFKVRIE